MGALSDLVQEAHSICELSIAQVGLQEPEQGQQQALEVGPPLVAGSQQQLWHQVAVAHQVQPGKCKPRHTQRLQTIAPHWKLHMLQTAAVEGQNMHKQRCGNDVLKCSGAGMTYKANVQMKEDECVMIYLHQSQSVGQGCQHAKHTAISWVIGRQGADQAQEHAVVGPAVEVPAIEVSIRLQLGGHHACCLGHQRRSPSMRCSTCKASSAENSRRAEPYQQP